MGRRAGVPQGRGGAVARRLRIYLAAELLVLACAILLSVVLANDGDPLGGDVAVTRKLQDLPAFHDIARGFRWGMGTEGVLAVGAVIAVALWMARRRWEAGVLLCALLALRVAQPLVKSLVDRERPSEALVDRRAGFSSESFPSGHMMSAVVLCGVVAVVVWSLPMGSWKQWTLTGGLAVLVLLNGLSSVYMGVHWPSDIVGGVAWGLVIVIPVGWALQMRSGSPARTSG